MALEPAVTDTAALRRAYGCFPSGVTAICALRDGAPVGIAASSFTSVSLDPPLVSLCVQHTSTTWPHLAARSRLGVSVLGQAQDLACKQLAARTGDRFAGLRWETTNHGAVLLHGAAAWLTCSIEQEVPAGDHKIVLLRVCELATFETAPLVFHDSRFRQLAAA